MRNITTLPVINDRSANVIDVRFAAPYQFACTLSHLCNEVLSTCPSMNTEDISDVLLSDFVKDWLDVRFRVGNTLCSHHSLENFIRVALSLVINNTRTVNQVNALSQRDVLPDLSLTWDRRDLAARLFHQRVDH